MKKDRFLWSAHRITERQKAGKARSIKEKQLKNSRNTVSRQLVVRLSSARDNFPFGVYICQKAFLMGRLFVYPGILCSSPGLFTQEFRI